MFRRLSDSLPKDPQIPADLTKLGYFVNDHDEIRQITDPGQTYQFTVNRNERVNELHKEAMKSCIRSIVVQRLLTLDLEKIRLPVDAVENEPHVPILVSKGLARKKRVIVVFGERHQDLGIFSYRVITDQNIGSGSAIDFVSGLEQMGAIRGDENAPGVIIANPGQLFWYRGGCRAVAHNEWMQLPRKSAVYNAFRIDPVKNMILGNHSYEEHIQYIFEHVMCNMVSSDAKFDLIGLEYAGYAMIKYLAKNWSNWSDRITGMCLGSPQHNNDDLKCEESTAPDFAQFVSKRCRAYCISSSALETPMAGREYFGCNCYSSGEEMYPENVIVAGWRSMLDWFNLLHASPAFEEVEFTSDQNMEAGDNDSVTVDTLHGQEHGAS